MCCEHTYTSLMFVRRSRFTRNTRITAIQYMYCICGLKGNCLFHGCREIIWVFSHLLFFLHTTQLDVSEFGLTCVVVNRTPSVLYINNPGGLIAIWAVFYLEGKHTSDLLYKLISILHTKTHITGDKQLKMQWRDYLHVLQLFSVINQRRVRFHADNTNVKCFE